MMDGGFELCEFEYATQVGIEIELQSRAAVERLALGLALLDESLARSLLLLVRNKRKLKLVATPKTSRFTRKSDHIDVALDANALGYLKVFALTAVRDDVPMADHVDIDFPDNLNKGPATTLTVRIPQRAREGI